MNTSRLLAFLLSLPSRHVVATVTVLAGFFAIASPRDVLADTFNVFCIPSVDGVSTCSGWSDGGTLTCVSSVGGVASCRSTTGRQFTCVQDSGGVTSCQNPMKSGGRSGKGDQCTYIGNGSFSCGKQPKANGDLIPAPQVIDEPSSTSGEDMKLTIPGLIP